MVKNLEYLFQKIERMVIDLLDSNRCVCCSADIPEGKHVCSNCETNEHIKDSGERTLFVSGAVRDMHLGKGRYDLLPWEAIHEVAKHCEEGALKYGERNCEKGIPIHSLIDSATRHLSCYLRGMKDEPHLRAAAWNILFAIYMELKHPEMQDIPVRKDDENVI